MTKREWNIAGLIIARIIAAILLFWAIDKHPYGYYKLLRFVVCGVSAYSAYFALKLNKTGWVWVLGMIALLFNPLIPVHLDKDTWAIIDIGVAIILLASIFFLRLHAQSFEIKTLKRQADRKKADNNSVE